MMISHQILVEQLELITVVVTTVSMEVLVTMVIQGVPLEGRTDRTKGRKRLKI
jgi:hypothetical protein